MRISRLEATDVHGYLPIRVSFHEDLTFLTGLNGSGKTTALRLLMGLLAPSLDELVDIRFGTAKAVILVEEKEIIVSAERLADGLTLSISTHKGMITLPAAHFQVISEAHTPIYLEIQSNPVFRAIRDLSTPMFLGLDRRLQIEERDVEVPVRARRLENEFRHRVGTLGDISIRRVTEAILSDVNDLVASTLSEIRAAQERLDEDLRNKILLDSFRYESTEFEAKSFPTRPTLEKFRARQTAIEKAAAGLRLPVGELQSSLSEFFDRMTKTSDALEAQSKVKPLSKARRGKTPIADPKLQGYVFEWIMNSRQAVRIFTQIEMLDDYVGKRATLHQPIDRFLALANEFLVQTGKNVTVSQRGSLRVGLKGAETGHPLFALSSGERQLVVMLAHLSLNKRLSQSGVFIVDEPELSLHIGWQEQFVNAIQQANPNVQFILATHSPAIILERIDNCRSLS